MLYSQRDKKWRKNRLGTCDTNIGDSGCLITILAVLFDKTPLEINDLLLLNGGYFAGCLVNWKVASKILDFEYLGSGKTAPVFYPCIAEVKFGSRSHFILMFDSVRFFDPWYGDIESLSKRYKKIVSYRYIRIAENVKNSLADDFNIIMAIFRKYLFA